MVCALLQTLTVSPEWKDNFPLPVWKPAVEAWLLFMSRQKQFTRYVLPLKSRLPVRDEALAEIIAAYFFGEILKYSFLNWQPPALNNQKGTFTLTANKSNIFCNVRHTDPDLVKIDPEAFLMAAIEQCYDMHPPGQANLLFFVGGFTVKQPPLPLQKVLYPSATYGVSNRRVSFTGKTLENISAVATLNIFFTDQLIYYWDICENMNAKVTLPQWFLKRKAEFPFSPAYYERRF